MTANDLMEWALAIALSALFVSPVLFALIAGVYMAVEYVRSWFTKEDA